MNNIISKLLNLLSPPTSMSKQEVKQVISQHAIHATNHAVPVYPPVDQGIPSQSIANVMQTQSDLLMRYRQLAGGKEDHFNKYYLTIIENLAAYIQLLPASQTSTHNGAGGLFRLCLEVAFYSLQSSGGHVFCTQEGIEEKKELEPRWTYATFIASISCELYRIVSDMIVTDQAGNVWPKYQKSLTQWCADEKIDRYFVRWHSTASANKMVTGRSDVSPIINAIMPPYVFQYLDDSQSKLIPIVFAVASGSSHPSENKIAEIVTLTRQKVFKKDESTRRERYGQLTVGSHLDPYIVNAMRTLISEKKWLVNMPKSRLWYAKEGVFIIWKSAAKEIIEEIKALGFSGVPNNHTTLAEMLIESQICESAKDSIYFMIKPQDGSDFYQALKLKDPSTLIEEFDGDFAVIEFQNMEQTKDTPKVTKPRAPKTTKIVNTTEQHPENDAVDEIKPTIKKTKEKITAVNQLGLPGIDDDNDDVALSTNDEVTHTTQEDTQLSVQEIMEIESLNHATTSMTESDDSNSQVYESEIADIAEIKHIEQEGGTNNTYLTEHGKKVIRDDMYEVVETMIKDFRTSKHPNLIFKSPTGVAFELQQMQAYGVSLEKLLNLFVTNGWLDSPPDNVNRKYLQVVNPEGKTIKCAVIKTEGAKLIGMLHEG